MGVSLAGLQYQAQGFGNFLVQLPADYRAAELATFEFGCNVWQVHGLGDQVSLRQGVFRQIPENEG
ncbi:hypothetical protein [Roseateles sp. BYS87W]|uniref:Uncharacterized protein n=1 Tax=Pelomonas baiyunensis TaxID=3299026 RepID=A0ABW7GYP3_9BURK